MKIRITEETLDMTEGKEYKILDSGDDLIMVIDDIGDEHWLSECEYEIVEGNNMKNFREVIRDIKEGEVWENKTQRIGKIYINENGFLQLEGENGFSCNYSTCADLEAVYELKQQPVTFEEVLNSDKKCMVEHEKLTHETFKEYVDFDVLMNRLSRTFFEVQLKEIIKNGKWYLEP